MASNTPNLDLLKKDPAIDGNDTFNIQTMLNDNWDKIDEAVGQVREEIQDIDVPAASLTMPGIVQLDNATNSTSETMAATPKAVKSAYDRADAAFTAGNERKAELVAALVAKGVTATTSETWAQLLAKVTALIKATGNATAADLLSGKTASNNNGPITGTMTNRSGAYQGATIPADASVTPGIIDIKPYKGYWDGNTYGGITDPDFIAANIRADKNIFGLQGGIPVSSPDISDQLYSANVSYGPYTSGYPENYLYIGVPAGSLLNGVNWMRVYQPNLIASNVRSGVPLFNGQLVGTLAPSVGGIAALSSQIIASNTDTPVGDSYRNIFTFPAGVKFINFMSDFNEISPRTLTGGSNSGAQGVEFTRSTFAIVDASNVASDFYPASNGQWSIAGFTVDLVSRSINATSFNFVNNKYTTTTVSLPANFNVNAVTLVFHINRGASSTNSNQAYTYVYGKLVYG